jgi:hypothetical protein
MGAMKRKVEKQREDYHATYGDPQSDFTRAQLRWIGAVAMNYNEAEALIDTAFFHATKLGEDIRWEVSTRINGIDGKIEIIQAAAKNFGLDAASCKEIAVSLGEPGFKLIKGYRDAIIHARAFNAPKGLGIRVDRRARIYEVLLTSDALKTLFEHIRTLRAELFEVNQLLLYASQLPLMRAGQGKEQLEAVISIATVQLRSHRNWRLSLQQLPKFPSESELLEARDIWHQAQLRVQQETLDAILGKSPIKRRR